MPARQGPTNPWSGPRLPASPQKLSPEDIGDPANGEKVERCLTCGSPQAPVTGTFVPDRDQMYAGRTFRYRLCPKCISHANGPQTPDPLHVEEDAA